jgi:hypothetical protein
MCYFFILLLAIAAPLSANGTGFAKNFRAHVQQKVSSNTSNHRTNLPLSFQHLLHHKQVEKICTVHETMISNHITFCKLSNLCEIVQAHLQWYYGHHLAPESYQMDRRINPNYYCLEPWWGSKNGTEYLLKQKLLNYIHTVPASRYFEENSGIYRKYKLDQMTSEDVAAVYIHACIPLGSFVRTSPLCYLDFDKDAVMKKNGIIKTYSDVAVSTGELSHHYLNALADTISCEHNFKPKPYSLLKLLDILKKCPSHVVLTHISIPLEKAEHMRSYSREDVAETLDPKIREQYLQDPSSPNLNKYYYLPHPNIEELKVHNFIDLQTKEEINDCLRYSPIPELPEEYYCSKK